MVGLVGTEVVLGFFVSMLPLLSSIMSRFPLLPLLFFSLAWRLLDNEELVELEVVEELEGVVGARLFLFFFCAFFLSGLLFFVIFVNTVANMPIRSGVPDGCNNVCGKAAGRIAPTLPTRAKPFVAFMPSSSSAALGSSQSAAVSASTKDGDGTAASSCAASPFDECTGG